MSSIAVPPFARLFLTTVILATIQLSTASDQATNSHDNSHSSIKDTVNLFSLERQTVDRDDLQCLGCDDWTTPGEDCCACHSTPVWEGNETGLVIEYISVLGKSLVVPGETVNNDTVYKIEVRDDVMGDIPSNVCDWDDQGVMYHSQLLVEFSDFWNTIVKIDFTGNEIRKIVDLNCLSQLDTLNLGFNKITYLRNDSFNNLTHLRMLNLEQNSISTMDPSVLTDVSLHLTHVYLQDNLLQELDITNGMSLYPFCTIDYSNNTIREITNIHDYKLDSSHTYGPGLVTLQENKITRFPDLSDLFNLDSVQELGQLLDFGFDFRNIPLECDGMMAPYLEVARQIPDSYWRHSMDVVCSGPDGLEGKAIRDISLDELVTDYPCYIDCECQDRPSMDYVYVNCSGRGITDMSKGELPNPRYINNVHLIMSNNDIQVVTNISDLSMVTVFDISNNNIVEITDDAANQLDKLTLLNLTNNGLLKAIPEQFRYVNTCSIHLSGIILDCDCDTLWISDWSNDNCSYHNETAVLCRVPKHGVMPAYAFNQDMLDCNPLDMLFTRLAIALSILISTLSMLAIATYYLRYELLIILMRLRRCKTVDSQPGISIDAFVSFDVQNKGLRSWVKDDLIPELEERRYNIFMPFRDICFGAVRDNAVIETLIKTRNILVILSQSYANEEDTRDTEIEWKYGWHMYKADKFKNIILVNYDHLSSFDVDHPQIKAFLRVGGPVDFTNDGRDIIDQITTKLGPPLPKARYRRPHHTETALSVVDVEFESEEMSELKDEHVNKHFGATNTIQM